MNKSSVLAAVCVAALVGAGCGEQPSDDRSDQGGGAEADAYEDTSEVTVWRNVDDAPNIVTFCSEGVRFASTLSSDGYKTPTLLVMPDFAQTCQR